MPSFLGERIHKRRKELKLSLDKLAELTNSSKSYLWELENRDEANPSADKIALLATVLSVTPGYLLNPVVTLDEEERDNAYFRKFQQLDEPDKARIRQMIDMWNEEKRST
jgi:transcriptional regulator with XRE-family HTH domain